MFETMFEADSFHFSKSYRDILHFIYFWQLGIILLANTNTNTICSFTSGHFFSFPSFLFKILVN